MSTELALHDIHLPEPISWFPPALGWWVLFGFIIVAIIAGFWWWQYYRSQYLQRFVLQALESVATQYQQTQDTQQLVIALSRLLRRVCLSYYPRQQVAGLTGDAWLQFLDQFLTNKPFTDGIGRVLASSPYQAHVEVDAPALLDLCRAWLRAFVKQKMMKA
ncbi:hypothetical protein BegalDRAFT_3236 [Beggiatoa alba B18LD]|uniref:DUF4381 domain-containing protein n=1 Tax=Beggiatoa alba B18LD TaxID=395493 RepID=I3CKB4_9GAMM|nr:DUF4381 domain-containing protein [Beggiatoa alba]EIJ44057.1 hypothetical protein BegalDRAFT_3236 [Beggiatoa alba B18LD]